MEPGRYRISAEVDVKEQHPSGHVGVTFVDGGAGLLHTDQFDFEKVLPEEPPHRAVVIDRDGDAWQLRTDGWCMARIEESGNEYAGYTWEQLLEDYAPVKVIHTP